MPGPIGLTIRTHSKRDPKKYDTDNLSAKALIDGLTDGYVVYGGRRILEHKGIIPDDNASIIPSITLEAVHDDEDYTEVLITS